MIAFFLYFSALFAEEPPIIQIVRSANPALLQQIIAKKDGSVHALGSNGQTGLHEAARRCSIWAARLLVDAGVDRLVRDGDGQTAAMIAADCPPSNDRLTLIRLVMAPIPRREATNEETKWSLQNAASHGDANVANMLLQMGADVNAVGSNGNRAIEIAARKNNLLLVTMFLERGADVKLRTSAGSTLLHEAALGGDAGIIELLIKAGADINAADTETQATPLHYAASFNRAEAVEALLKGGADRNRRDAKKRTARDLAVENHYSQIADLLK